MAPIRLARLPDRTPVRLTISLSPTLHRTLTLYAGFYKEAYGDAEPLIELIPAMLGAFLDGDRDFQRYRRSSE